MCSHGLAQPLALLHSVMQRSFSKEDASPEWGNTGAHLNPNCSQVPSPAVPWARNTSLLLKVLGVVIQHYWSKTWLIHGWTALNPLLISAKSCHWTYICLQFSSVLWNQPFQKHLREGLLGTLQQSHPFPKVTTIIWLVFTILMFVLNICYTFVYL